MEFSENCMLDPRENRMEFGYFTADNVPKGTCERHVILKYDKLSQGIATDFCPEEELINIALIKIDNRSFPYEIEITDAEYVMRETDTDSAYPRSYNAPYFYNSLPEGEYAGKSKGKKQFNSPCYIHRK